MNITNDIDNVKNKFTIYWKNGKREVITGETIEDAFSKAGYGGGAVHAIDFYMDGEDTNYERIGKEWVRTTPVFNPN